MHDLTQESNSYLKLVITTTPTCGRVKIHWIMISKGSVDIVSLNKSLLLLSALGK